jgi:ATP-dependent Lhr-like helicase
MLSHSLVHLGGYSWCLFPWLGTRSFRTVRRLIKKLSPQFRISGIEYAGCYYITFKMSGGNDYELARALARETEDDGIDRELLVSNSEIPVFEKYDDYIPADLLRRAYAIDKLEKEDTEERMRALFAEF